MIVKEFIPSKNYEFFVILMLLTAVVLLFWVSSTRLNDFHDYHQSTARDATTNVAVEVSHFVAEKKRLVELFGREKIDLINRFTKNPSDEQLYNQLAEGIATYFPNYFAFTVADAYGTPYLEDFEGFVGQYCKNDIKQFAKLHAYRPRIHPNPEAYHFDIMASIGTEKNSPILFISFHADILTGLIASSQTLGHDLMLIYPDLKSLIEVTADGARNHLVRDNYRLSQQEQDRIMFQKPVPGTMWYATDLRKPELFKQYWDNIVTQSMLIFFVFATIGWFTIVIIRREESRRQIVDRELVIAKEEADIANKAKSEFLANMSHELRTPLNIIIGYSEMLAEDSIKGHFKELSQDLGKIRYAGKHLLTLIDEILDLSKIEAGQMEVHLDDFDLGALINEVVATVQPLVEKNNNHLIVKCDDELGHIRSDPIKVSQIIFNLVSNASKFTTNGTISVNLLEEKIDGHACIKIDVTDTGIGMTQTQIERIFQPFAQADSSTTRKYGGTGLGLAITQRFCTMLGGKICVSSEASKGSVFSVWIKTNMSDTLEDKHQAESTVIDLTNTHLQPRDDTIEEAPYNKYKARKGI